MEMKAIIFDMDGLMIDSERLYIQAQDEITAQFGKRLPEEVRFKMMGRKPIESITLFVKELEIPAKPEDILAQRNKMMKEKMQNELEAMPGLYEILNEFNGQVKLAVCTGAQGEFLDIALDRLDIRDRFAVLQSSDDVNQGKPHPEIVLKACEKLGLEPNECVVLEDSLNGVLAAKIAGCYTIAVPTEYTRFQDFTPAHYVAEDLLEARDHIKNSLL